MFQTCSFPNSHEKHTALSASMKSTVQVNVVAKRCAHLECPVNPRFNYEGQPRGLYCSEHKLQGDLLSAT